LSLAFGDIFDPGAILAVGDDLLLLGTDRRLFRAQGLSIDHIAIGCDVTAHHCFSETEAGLDDELRTLPGGRVGGEQNS